MKFRKNKINGNYKEFRDLDIWKLSRTLCQQIFIYISREDFAKDYKLNNQINSASNSVMDNIAEGFDRGSRNEFVRFLSISKGSAGEVKSQLFRALDRKYITKDEFETSYQLTEDISKRINKLISYLNKSLIKGETFKDRVQELQAPYLNLTNFKKTGNTKLETRNKA